MNLQEEIFDKMTNKYAETKNGISYTYKMKKLTMEAMEEYHKAKLELLNIDLVTVPLTEFCKCKTQHSVNRICTRCKKVVPIRK